jgi:septal ring-binding cell division protein DamX
VTNKTKILLAFMVMLGFIFVGCAGQKRIEGMDIPTQPGPSDVVIPTPTAVVEALAPPEVPTEAPTVAPTEVPTQEAEAPPPPEPTVNPCNSYIVVKGDTLWGISGSGSGYKDFFLWPLIFKANRDQITDPDLIYPKQEFCIRQDFTDKDKTKAHKDASDTPKYVPHTKPRETLPLDYF